MNRLILAALLTLAVACGVEPVTRTQPQGLHSWGAYHWATSTTTLSLDLGDNLGGPWSAHLADAVDDWNLSAVLDLSVVAGAARGRCKATTGRIEVCNDHYGATGWLGLAQIWVDGDHIVKAIAKNNDTYFDMPQYDTWAWRQLVMCQEIAHGFGLGHQDEVFDNPNLGTCMDYTDDPLREPANIAPNAHDYDQLELIYDHVEGGGGDSEPPPPADCWPPNSKQCRDRLQVFTHVIPVPHEDHH